MAKFKNFEVIFFLPPTEADFKHYHNESKRKKIPYHIFESLWFQAYNEYVAMAAAKQFYNHATEVAALAVQISDTAKERNIARRFLNDGARYWSEKTGIEFPTLKLEDEGKNENR